ncbi:Glutamate synthase [NADPH] large chain [hydrothermal vent metagenome]|uniref:Glutamate synthase [NADPH] large chain n=1 Tax=hydrothermal vent metagenome TaxID=652676 RepID=A0A3B1C2D3_9ZZZZ
MDQLIILSDRYIIALYKLTGIPLLDYFLGSFLLCALAVVVGEIMIKTVFVFNSEHIHKSNKELVDMKNLSMQAAEAGEREAYKACNKLANDAFGKVFFQSIALSSAKLCPAFFALSWTQYRFFDIKFPISIADPLFQTSIGYAPVFIMFYILARIAIGNAKHQLLKLFA